MVNGFRFLTLQIIINFKTIKKSIQYIKFMNSRDRIISAINHIQPDKVPIDLGSSTVTGISAIAYNKLKRHLKIDQYKGL